MKSDSGSGSPVTAIPGFSLKVYGIRSSQDKRQRHRLVEDEVNSVGDVVSKTNALCAVALKRRNGTVETLPENSLPVGTDDSIVLVFQERKIALNAKDRH